MMKKAFLFFIPDDDDDDDDDDEEIFRFLCPGMYCVVLCYGFLFLFLRPVRWCVVQTVLRLIQFPFF